MYIITLLFLATALAAEDLIPCLPSRQCALTGNYAYVHDDIVMNPSVDLRCKCVAACPSTITCVKEGTGAWADIDGKPVNYMDAAKTVTAGATTTNAFGFSTPLTVPAATFYSTQFGSPIAAVRSVNSFARFSITDGSEKRFEIRDAVEYPRVEPSTSTETDKITYTPIAVGGKFDLDLKFGSASSSKSVKIVNHSIVLEDQFMQVALRVNTKYISGFGEHEHGNLFRERDYGTQRILPTWVRSNGVGTGPNHRPDNLYGAHPVGILHFADGSGAVLFFENASPQEFELIADGEDTLIVWRCTGGVPTFNMFAGDTIQAAIKSYHQYIGTPFKLPWFALGHQLSRYGYLGLAEVKQLHMDMDTHGLPYDIQTWDIDYMRRSLDFTVDTREMQRNFSKMNEYIMELRGIGVQSIMMFDPAISAGDALFANDAVNLHFGSSATALEEVDDTANYGVEGGVFMSGLKEDVFMKHNTDKKLRDLHIGYLPTESFVNEIKSDCTATGGVPVSNNDSFFHMCKATALQYTEQEGLASLGTYSNLDQVLLGKVWPFLPHVNMGSICEEHIRTLYGTSPRFAKEGCDWGNLDLGGSGCWHSNVAICSAPAAFPDFFKPSAKQWWSSWIRKWLATFAVDAFWIDMNEPENFSAGSLGDSDLFARDAATFPDTLYNKTRMEYGYGAQCGLNKYNFPPYRIHAIEDDKPLYAKTACMDAKHNINGKTVSHYDVHSLYGFSQGLATRNAALGAQPNPNPFVFGRSTYPGSGHYQGHWYGDNSSNYAHMRMSLIGMMDFASFGIPFGGADICGFFDNSNITLCYYWIQLGAFYPFSRNHNGIGWVRQDPGYWAGQDPAFATNTKAVMTKRYELNSYLYSLFRDASLDGTMPVRSLFHEFSSQLADLAPKKDVVDRMFMYGRNIAFAPMVEDLGDTTAAAHTAVVPYKSLLPKHDGGGWYSSWTGAFVDTSGGQLLVDEVGELFASKIPIYYRAGSVMMLKVPAANNAATFTAPFRLVVNRAKGEGLNFAEAQHFDVGSGFGLDEDFVTCDMAVTAGTSETTVAISCPADLVGNLTEVIVNTPEKQFLFAEFGLDLTKSGSVEKTVENHKITVTLQSATPSSAVTKLLASVLAFMFPFFL